MSPEIKIVDDFAALNHAGEQEIFSCAREAISARGRFTIALSGGSTPKGTFALLAAAQKDPAQTLSWSNIHIFFSDERHVPPDDPASNYRMANESLLAKVPVPPQNVHRVKAELEANAAAQAYETELKGFFGASEWPRFDLVMLGMGPDGHTASLFPGSPALEESVRWVAANWVEKFHQHRLTFTFPLINHAAEVMFLVSGDDKADVLKQVFKSGAQDLYPCQRVRPVSGKLLWILDKSAAKLL